MQLGRLCYSAYNVHRVDQNSAYLRGAVTRGEAIRANRFITTVIAGSALLILAVASCSKREGGESVSSELGVPQDITSIRALLTDAWSALIHCNESGFLSCFHIVDNHQRAALKSIISAMKAIMRFRDLFINCYGEKAWHCFNDRGCGLWRPRFRFALPNPDAPSLIKSWVPRPAAGKCECDVEIFPNPRRIQLVKVGGKWFIEASSFLGESGDVAKFMESLGALVKKFRVAVCAPGVRPQDINYELARHFLGWREGRSRFTITEEGEVIIHGDIDTPIVWYCLRPEDRLVGEFEISKNEPLILELKAQGKRIVGFLANRVQLERAGGSEVAMYQGNVSFYERKKVGSPLGAWAEYKPVGGIISIRVETDAVSPIKIAVYERPATSRGAAEAGGREESRND